MSILFTKKGKVGLYKTDDGGLTWLSQDINVPIKYMDYMITSNIPQFFTEDVGLLFLCTKDYNTDSEYIYFSYVTIDGGITWSFLEESTIEDNTQWCILETDDKGLVKYEVTYNGEKWELSWQDSTYVNGSWEKIK